MVFGMVDRNNKRGHPYKGLLGIVDIVEWCGARLQEVSEKWIETAGRKMVKQSSTPTSIGPITNG